MRQMRKPTEAQLHMDRERKPLFIHKLGARFIRDHLDMSKPSSAIIVYSTNYGHYLPGVITSLAEHAVDELGMDSDDEHYFEEMIMHHFAQMEQDESE